VHHACREYRNRIRSFLSRPDLRRPAFSLSPPLDAIPAGAPSLRIASRASSVAGRHRSGPLSPERPAELGRIHVEVDGGLLGKRSDQFVARVLPDLAAAPEHERLPCGKAPASPSFREDSGHPRSSDRFRRPIPFRKSWSQTTASRRSARFLRHRGRARARTPPPATMRGRRAFLRRSAAAATVSAEARGGRPALRVAVRFEGGIGCLPLASSTSCATTNATGPGRPLGGYPKRETEHLRSEAAVGTEAWTCDRREEPDLVEALRRSTPSPEGCPNLWGARQPARSRAPTRCDSPAAHR